MAGRRLTQLMAVLSGRAPRAVSSGTYSGTGDTYYDIEITTAGVSTAAIATWKQITAGVLVTSGTVTLTSGSAATIGALGLSVVFTWTGRLPLGQGWRVEAFDTGDLFGPALPHDDILVSPSVPLAADVNGALLVSSSVGGVAAALTLRDYAATINATNVITVTFTGTSHGFTVYNGTASPVDVSIDGTNYNLTLQAYGDSSGLYLPPGGYLNAAGKATIKVKGTIGGQSGTVTVTSWEV